MSFAETLKIGQAAESAIARWLRSRGSTVLPVYEKIIDEGKGPQVFLPDGSLVAPDLFTWRGEQACWIEAKHKTGFTYHQLSGRWQTGVDLRHYKEYLKVAELSPWPLWLLFLHSGGWTKDAPEQSPDGLYGGKISKLMTIEDHRFNAPYGSGGMVYWNKDDLKFMASYDEVVGF